ncbi:hypothetical protein PYW08_006022 [Mythimna loreyi]|uniref:Uncharacterized protein n=1 Tax=Mythimna loreyi TaxID=667449 RepID=A0ACC2QMF9_9NEOP|nr:hypothetical protein PYW08_006022 [Mythimna loreyi]
MRTGDTDDRISTLLKVPRRRTLESLIDKVRSSPPGFCTCTFRHKAFKSGATVRTYLLIPNGVYGNGNNAIVICDGTYIYINKSSNYMFQKQSYNLHKYRNLLKPFMFVACDGYIVDCYGPYKATTSDVDIMSVYLALRIQLCDHILDKMMCSFWTGGLGFV